eukprot:CAMPEP_0171180936 /NCGR_PEP_ID=MMETSP0790-20130122/14008_1 /TAXON_ID=2925 /ORGANISM="Alexandrium catenella, Strain OF101" /LENGTH=387 /DNA_ID=CAMNT_0011645873 /DNA_START=18 /DNA_END=1179 /DNA_ORIENTATION=-
MALNDVIAASSGAAGAATSTVILYPLDVLKTHLNRGVDHKGQKYAGAQDVVNRVWQEHGPLGFYKGLGTRTSHQVVQKFAFYYVYDGLRRIARSMLQTQRPSFAANLVIGYIAGVVTVLVANPLEVLSTRQQLSAKDGGKSTGMLARLASMTRDEGIGVFYRGSMANFILAINPAIENAIFDKIKDFFLKLWAAKSLSVPQAFWFGAVAKIIATAITFPYIRAKVIIQAAQSKAKKTNGDAIEAAKASPTQNSVSAGPSTLEVLSRIVQDEGLLALWKGMTPQAVKAVLSSAVLLAAKEKIEVVVRRAILALARKDLDPVRPGHGKLETRLAMSDRSARLLGRPSPKASEAAMWASERTRSTTALGGGPICLRWPSSPLGVAEDDRW